jgi:hypothetical protein
VHPFEPLRSIYRLRWLIELLFRELKQATDFGRSFTANARAVQVLTYGAMLAHVLVRSLRIQTALANDVPLERWSNSGRSRASTLRDGGRARLDIARGVVNCHRPGCKSAAGHRPRTQTVTLAWSDCFATWRSLRLADRPWPPICDDPALFAAADLHLIPPPRSRHAGRGTRLVRLMRSWRAKPGRRPSPPAVVSVHTDTGVLVMPTLASASPLRFLPYPCSRAPAESES